MTGIGAFGVNSLGECFRQDALLDEQDLMDWELDLLHGWDKVAPLATDLFRFRVAGGRVWCSTEFYGYLNDDKAWRRILRFVDETGGLLSTFDQGKEVDKSKKQGDADWTIGPNHNRAYRQVAVEFDVTEDSVEKVKELLNKLRNVATATGADHYWVSVL